MGEMRKKIRKDFSPPMGVKAPKTIKKELRINILYEEIVLCGRKQSQK